MSPEPASILIIDTDASSRTFLSETLEKAGYPIFTAAGGREGLISAWRDHPTIIVLDPLLPDIPGVELVKRLIQDRRTAQVLFIALSGQPNDQEKADLLAAGCKEYLPKSSQAVSELLEIIPALTGGQKPTPPKKGLLVTFLSAKGGAGTTSLCANIAMCLGSENIQTRVAVVDLVLPMGSVGEIVGAEEKLNLVTVTGQPPELRRVAFFRDDLPRMPGWYFHLLAGSPDPETSNQLAVEQVEPVIAAIVDGYDFVFVDAGRSLSRISLPILQKSDVVVLVVGSDLSSLNQSCKVWNFLKSKGMDEQHVFVIQNRALGLEGMTRDEMQRSLGLRIQTTIPYMSDNLTVANNRHEPIISREPNSSVSVNLKQTAARIVEAGQLNRVQK